MGSWGGSRSGSLEELQENIRDAYQLMVEDEAGADNEVAWAAEIELRVRRVQAGEGRFEDWHLVRDELRPRS
jgi:hypothetical protein